MKSAILVESKKPLLVENIELPENIKFGQVLVKIYYSGICGAQINEIDALKGPDKFLPHLLGHEGSGIVEKVGEGVKTVNPGIMLCSIGGQVMEFKVQQQNIIGMAKRLTLDGLPHLMKKQ